jgi:hypothetical protein
VERQKKAELVLRVESGFRLIEQVEALAEETILEQGEEGLPMRLRVERFATIGNEGASIFALEFVKVGGHIEEAFGSQEKALGQFLRPRETQRVRQRRGGVNAGRRLAREIPASAFAIEASVFGDGLKQRRLPEPFSPTKKQTRVLSLSSEKFRTAGTLNG